MYHTGPLPAPRKPHEHASSGVEEQVHAGGADEASPDRRDRDRESAARAEQDDFHRAREPSGQVPSAAADSMA